MGELRAVWQVEPYLGEVEGSVYTLQDAPVPAELEEGPVLVLVALMGRDSRRDIVAPLVPQVLLAASVTG